MTRATIQATGLETIVAEALNRWATAGMAIGVVEDQELVWFRAHGTADIESGAAIDEDTVFRLASITKTFTAIAVMQLWEQGLIELDAPADDYLTTFALVPAKSTFGPPTIRHLLTHTAGVRAVRGPSDLFRYALAWGAAEGQPPPALEDYYRRGLHIDVEPGTRWAYTNHGFATLGQIVADITGTPLDRYFREHIFEPLGMESSDLVASPRISPRLANGYELGSRGLKLVRHREMATTGASAAYSTMRDMTRYVGALVRGGANDHGAILKPETLAMMFEPHYQPDMRLPGMGLGFFREDVGGHAAVGHDGIWHGFRTDMVLSPADGLGVVVLANSGGFNPGGAPVPLGNALLRRVLDVPDRAIRTDVADQPANWHTLTGWYSFGPGVLLDPQPRMGMGAGLEVVVRRGHLMVRGQMPVPAVRRGLRLHPDADDPTLFHVDLSALGMGTTSVAFSQGDDGEATALHLAVLPMSFHRRPDVLNPRPWMTGALATGAAALALRRRIKR